MAVDDDATIALLINGKKYSINPDDLELGEIEIIEDECDEALETVDFRRARAMRVLVYTLMHREDPTFTMDDARAIKLSAIEEQPPEPPPAPPVKGKPRRPTPAAPSG